MDEGEKKISVLCLGPTGSGKTTLLKKLQEAEGIDYTYSPVPTIGTNLYDIHYTNKSGKKQIMTVREVGGEMVSFWKNYLDGVEKQLEPVGVAAVGISPINLRRHEVRQVIFVVDTSNLCQISAAAVSLYTLLAEPKLRNAKFILVLSKMDAAYRQMRNEALLMLQHARLKTELSNAPTLLEASPLTGEGLDELRSFLADTKRVLPFSNVKL